MAILALVVVQTVPDEGKMDTQGPENMEFIR
jgi:hypothetical protein